MSTSEATIEKEWCERLREYQQASGISQIKMAKEMSRILGHPWRQSRVWKLLWCEMPVTISAFDAAVQALGLTLRDFVMSGESGLGMFLDEGEREIIHRMRQTRTTEHFRRAVMGLCGEQERDRRVHNGAKPKRKQKASRQLLSRTA